MILGLLPILVAIVLLATAAVARSSRGDSAASVPAEPPLPAPASGVETAVLWPLTRRLAWRLFRHPAVIAGYVLTIPALAVFNEGSIGVLHREAMAAGIGAFPLAGLTLVAVNLMVLAPRRFGAQGMVDTTPASPATRTAAHLLSTLAPAAVMVVLLGAYDAILLATGAVGTTPSFADLALAPVLVVCAGFVGVLLAAWLHTPLVAVPAVIGLGLLEAFLNAPAPEYRPVRRLGWWVSQSLNVPMELLDRKQGMHLLYVLALGALLAAVALARFVRPRVRLMTILPAAALVAVTAFAATRPMSDGTAQRLAAWVNDAEAIQECRPAFAVRLCAYPQYDLRDKWQPVVEGVLRAAPVEPATPVHVIQRVPADALDNVSPAVLAHLDDDAWRADGAVHPELRWHPGSVDHLLAADVSALLVGLPVTQLEAGKVCVAADQARAVVALWLTAHGSGRAGNRVEKLAAPEGLDPDTAGSGALFPTFIVEGWIASYEPAVRWSVRDARYAVALLALEDRRVKDGLAARWSEVLAPSTTSDQLADWLGVALQPSMDELARGLGANLRLAQNEAMSTSASGIGGELPGSSGPC